MSTPTIEIHEELTLSPAQGPQCEGPNHPFARWGHIPDQGASWLIIPECGHDWLCCDGWLQDSYRRGAENGNGWFYECHECGAECQDADIVIVDIT